MSSLDHLLLSPATAMRDALLERRVSAADLTEAALARIARLNPALNAVVARDDEASRRAAADSDRRIADGEARPLEGLPITIKDAYDVAGLVSTAGVPSFKDRVPEVDAPTVSALRSAGAVILGKTNVPPFSGDFQSYNPIYGTTNNPWDVARSPGGSSGGAAVAVATGMAAFELGSDLGGSIRWPAHCCGLFGLKPTWGLVTTYGHVPPAPGMRLKSQTDLVVGGPLARSAGDLALLLPIMAEAGREGGIKLRPARQHEPKGLRVAVWADDEAAPVDAMVRDGVLAAADRLEAAGAIVSRNARPSFSFFEAFEVFALLNHALVAAGLPEKIRDRIAARAASFAAGDRSHEALQARGAKLDANLYARLLERRLALKQAWAAFFADYDVLLCPPAPVNAIAHDHTPDIHARRISVNGAPRPYFDIMSWAGLATGAHLPAAEAPVGLAANGLPSGVQIIAGEHEDMTAIAVAAMIEQAFGGFRAPPMAL